MCKDGNFYVYHIYGVDNELLYVGKGSGDRMYSHLYGTSSNVNINEYYFKNNKPTLTAKVDRYFTNESEALCYEKVSIETLRPPCNIVASTGKPAKPLKTNFKVVCRLYYNSFISNDIVKILEIDKDFPVLKEYVSKLGYEVLKTCGFQESKIKAKFKKSIGVGKVVTTPSKIHKILKYNIGDRHTLKKIKDDLNSAYTKLKIKNIAKAVDVEQYYNVKRTKINGNMGYKILGDK